MQHLDSIHPNIKFTMEMEHNKSLPFLDVQVSKKPDGSLAHTVYRKPTHTDLKLHAKSEHHPAQKKRAVLTTIIQHARSICNTESLEGEMEHLKKTFKQNGYSNGKINWALYPRHKLQRQCEEPTGVAMLPYQHCVTNMISKLLVKHIKTIHIPARKSIHMLGSVKDKLGLKVPNIYRIPCECGKVHVGQTGRTIQT
jgi:hypothetical protein